MLDTSCRVRDGDATVWFARWANPIGGRLESLTPLALGSFRIDRSSRGFHSALF
jgi:hypothetical protein